MAVDTSHLEVVKWLWEKGGVDSRVYEYAAKFDRLHILQWALDQGIEWLPLDSKKYSQCVRGWIRANGLDS